MFKSRKQQRQVVNPNTTDTLIGEGSVFEGKIRSQASIRVEGQIIGDIECLGDVTIGEQGTAKSNITARHVIIAGIVHGNVTAKETLKLMATGQLNGNTITQAFAIEEGGIFHGTSRMENKQQVSEKQKKTETEQSVAAFSTSPSAPGFHQETKDSVVSR